MWPWQQKFWLKALPVLNRAGAGAVVTVFLAIIGLTGLVFGIPPWWTVGLILGLAALFAVMLFFDHRHRERMAEIKLKGDIAAGDAMKAGHRARNPALTRQPPQPELPLATRSASRTRRERQ